VVLPERRGGRRKSRSTHRKRQQGERRKNKTTRCLCRLLAGNSHGGGGKGPIHQKVQPKFAIPPRTCQIYHKAEVRTPRWWTKRKPQSRTAVLRGGDPNSGKKKRKNGHFYGRAQGGIGGGVVENETCVDDLGPGFHGEEIDWVNMVRSRTQLPSGTSGKPKSSSLPRQRNQYCQGRGGGGRPPEGGSTPDAGKLSGENLRAEDITITESSKNQQIKGFGFRRTLPQAQGRLVKKKTDNLLDLHLDCITKRGGNSRGRGKAWGETLKVCSNGQPQGLLSRLADDRAMES